MAKVRLRVVPDDHPGPFVPGEAVAGRVEIEADEAVECSGLKISVGWKTEGEANAVAGPRSEDVVGAGKWNAGDRLTARFTLPIPSGPPTYRGRRFNLLWTVRAEADLAWAFDASAEASIDVGPAVAPEGKLVAVESTGGSQVGCAVFAVLLALGCLLPVLLGAPALPLVLFGGFGVLLALYAVPRAIAHRGMGKVTLEAGPSPAPRGGEIACRVYLRPRREIVPQQVQAVLTATETSVRGSGKHKSTRYEELAKISTTLMGPPSVHAGSQGEYAGLLAIPGDAPPSFEASPHGVAWKLKVTVDIPGLPDPDWELVIRVV